MTTTNSPIHLCSFTVGCYRVRSPNGKQGLEFEDSDRFGPAKINMKTGDLSEIPERNQWFWAFYTPWREAGRPLTGQTMSTPNGPLLFCAYANTATPDAGSMTTSASASASNPGMNQLFPGGEEKR